VKRPTFFASHPSMIERVKTIREIIESHPAMADDVPVDATAAAAREARYRDAVRAARLDYLKLAVETDRQKSVIAMLAPAFASGDCEPAAAFWLGEAYRLRGDEGDVERALRTYRWVLERAPQLAVAWRGIGEIQHRAGANDEAADAFARYLEVAPEATDAEAVRAELARLRARTDENGKESGQ
jgi:predicted Zn-dependent protease